MNKLFTLIKYSLFNSLSLNKFIKKKKGKGALILLILLALVVFVVFFGYMMLYGKMFYDGGVPGGILLLAISLGSFLTAITSITNTNSYLFNPKDFDMLMSMPIKTKTIFLSKAFDLLILNYISLAYFYLPAMIVYGIFNETNFFFWILGILVFFIIPLLPISVFGFISYLFSFLKINAKVKKIVRTLLYILLTTGIMVVSFSFSSNADEEAFFLSFFNKLKIYYPGYLLYLGLRGEYIYYLLFVLMSIVPFVLFMLFSSRTYLKSKTIEVGGAKSSNKKIKIKQTSKVKALFIKEIKNYFSIPIYIANTIIGPALGLIGTIFIVIRSRAEFVDMGDGNLVEMGVLLPFLVVLILTFATSMSPTTPSSVSLEGRSMWILKSAPLEYRDIINSKLFVNLVITVPFIVIVTIICLILKSFEWYEYLAILLIPTVFTLFISNIGLLFNLCKVRLDYDNPAKVIKQSMPIVLTMLVSFMAPAHLVGLSVVIYIAFESKILVYVFLLVLVLIIYIISKVLLKNVGKKLYNKIIC